MREIKFRAWDLEERCFCSIIEVRRDIIEHNFNNTFIDEIVFLQYTGLKDKNGVEIYEGDIVEYKHPRYDEDVNISSIEYQDDLCAFTINDGYFSSLDSALLSLKVIGNIYENSELLKNKGE